MGVGFRITEMWAFLAVDDDNDEGVMAFLGASGTWTPMVAADQERLDLLRPVAREMAALTGKRVVLAHFGHREADEVIADGAAPTS